MELSQKTCVPCQAGTPPLAPERIAELVAQLDGWGLSEDRRKISRRFQHPDFVQAMSFVNRMADLAEAEEHHPDFAVHYSVVDVTLWTHAIGGLSENDFILAAKIDQIEKPKTTK